MVMVTGKVTVRLKEGVLDPQGQTIQRALQQMGYAGIDQVRAGKTFEFKLQADSPDTAKAQLREMSEKLLANPVIETFHVEVVE
jgi:phosphoribosylformylglycinamidine synthase